MKSFKMIMSKFEYIGHVPTLRPMFSLENSTSSFRYLYNIIVIIRRIMLAT